MNKLRLLALLALVALVLLPAIAVTQGGLQPPCRFHGTVQVNGANVSDGTVITAKIWNYTYTTTTNDSSYAVTMAQPEGKSFEGQAVTFMIGTATASQTGTWLIGGNVAVNLTNGTRPAQTTRHLEMMVSPGQTFYVRVTFTAPFDDFNAIGLVDSAPAGWTIQSNVSACLPDANSANIDGNQVNYIWFGPYAAGSTLTAQYQVTVPSNAPAGSYTFNGQLGYKIGGESTAFEAITGDSTVQVHPNTPVGGIIREVNGNILSGAGITMDGASLVLSNQSGQYNTLAASTGNKNVLAYKDGFRNRTRTVNIAGLGEGYAVTCDFQGQYGLIPNAPDMWYALDCVNLWLYPPNPYIGLDMWTALDVVNAWLYPVTPTPTPTPLEQLEVRFIDVGQGDAILIDLNNIEILIDGGPESDECSTYLSGYVDGALEAMIATHPHADHIGGLIAVLDSFDVERIWTNGQTSTTQTYIDFINKVNTEGADVEVARRGDTIAVGKLILEVLNPVEPLVGDYNNNSIVLMLSYGDIDFLFMGDAEQEAEGGMIAENQLQDIDILKVGHHGSRTASSQTFLEEVRPEVAIYMAGIGNQYGHPHAETITALQNIGAQIYGTDSCGTVIVSTEGIGYTVSTTKTCATPTPTSTPSPSPTPTGASDVQIIDIFYDGNVPQVESDEYVAINNLGNSAQELTGWRLVDIADGYPSFIFPSYMLQPQETIRVYTNEIHLEWGGFSFGYGSAIWNNSDPDMAALYDIEGYEVSRKSY